ncbi:hypothetical protein IT774_05965 [Salinimonas marina]|uniref:DUF4234 domain-containing protein n=1 Tax=Salinimonas marina TaxID=2785918 RepID=A0A7S9DZT6_9ALTE|nr:hypothetical protein [Salinimonas marina]QPG06693.1 hypothetical protein IT774_05965 [Salinimonas marina]
MQHQAKARFITAPPRFSLLEGLLVFCTAGLYLPIWFYLAVRDIRRITDDELSPWSWTLVPLIFVVQPYALVRFTGYLRRAEKQLHLRRWPVLFDYLWMMVFFGCSVVFAAASIFEVETLTKMIVSVVSIVNFMLMHRRLNKLRKRCQNEAVAERYKGYNSLEWIAVVVFTPLIFGLFLYTYINSELHDNLRSKQFFKQQRAIEEAREETKDNASN